MDTARDPIDCRSKPFEASAPPAPVRKRHSPRRSALAAVTMLASLGVVGCKPSKPPQWEQGGARLVVLAAHWERAHSPTIIIRGDGTVYEDEDQILFVDEAGRVADANNDPVAILLSGGQLMARDDRFLGQLGVHNATGPSGGEAWLSVLPDGKVVYFNSDGERRSDGFWEGCGGPQMRTCLLVTQMMALRRSQNRSGPRFRIGVGVMMFR
ncbi:MAG: hypothetical protein HRU17_21500 [Polyangiaceae bacterium]|nr:hypothetical protein [Polyangiaceae bacterium]